MDGNYVRGDKNGSSSNDISRYYNYCITRGHYPSSCLLLKTQLISLGLSVAHKKHITSPLQSPTG
jgi:hypothetical protein